MKKILFLAVVLGLVACTTTKHEGYVINGTITGNTEISGKAYLSNQSKEYPVKDTAEIVKGKFQFKGIVTTPEEYQITFDGIKERVVFFLDNSDIKIDINSDSIAKSTVTGGVTNDLSMALAAQGKAIAEKYKMEELMNEYDQESTTKEKRDSILSTYYKYQAELDSQDSIFYANNPTSYLTINNLYRTMDDKPIAEVEAILTKVKDMPEFKDNRIVKDMLTGLESIKALQPGCKIADFTCNDPNGNPITLSQIYSKNKVTMIDFWASWCGPCRHFNPTLVKIYKEFHNKGFEVIGVSLDKDAESWNKGIKEDKLVWPQVSELAYWNGALVKQYRVRFVPQNIFVDKDGIILKRHLPEADIVPFLKEQLATKK